MVRAGTASRSRGLRRLLALLLVPATVHGRQSVLAAELTEDALERDAPFIFNSVHSLLRQWGNTLAPNGFSYSVCTIPAGTTLYHGRKDEHDPLSPEWLAFDAQMSYGIMAGRGGMTFLRTYRSTRTLGPLLYCDGMSAALTNSGTLDSQTLLIDGVVTERDWTVANDYTRAKRLCAEVAPRLGVEGFVRMNAGFELIWCDWTTGIELVLNNNVTHFSLLFNATEFGGLPAPPDSPERGPDDRGPRRPHELPPRAGIIHDIFAARQIPQIRLTGNSSSQLGTPTLDEPPPPPPPDVPPGPGFPRRPPPYGGRPPYGGHRGWPRIPYYEYTSWEWLRSATAVYAGSGESRVRIFPSTFVSAYGRDGLDLTLPDPATHRLVNTTLAPVTATAILDDVAQAVADFRDTNKPSSDIDWRSVTDQIVNQYGRRLPELHALLRNGTTDAIQRAQFSLASMLVHFYVPSLSQSENRVVCANTFMYGVDASTLPRHERTTLSAIQLVQAEICDVLLNMRDGLFPGDGTSPVSSDLPPETVERSAKLLLQLMARLRWDMWVQCDEHCSYAQVCYIEIWPLRLGGRGPPGPGGPGSGEVRPVCMGYA